MNDKLRQTVKFTLSQHTLAQIHELVSGGHTTSEAAAVTEAVDALYYHRVEAANRITLASRKVTESSAFPEMTEADGRVWINLGSGLLAESAAAMLLQQYPGDAEVRQTAAEDWLIFHRQAAQDGYATFRAVVLLEVAP